MLFQEVLLHSSCIAGKRKLYSLATGCLPDKRDSDVDYLNFIREVCEDLILIV